MALGWMAVLCPLSSYAQQQEGELIDLTVHAWYTWTVGNRTTLSIQGITNELNTTDGIWEFENYPPADRNLPSGMVLNLDVSLTTIRVEMVNRPTPPATLQNDTNLDRLYIWFDYRFDGDPQLDQPSTLPDGMRLEQLPLFEQISWFDPDLVDLLFKPILNNGGLLIEWDTDQADDFPTTIEVSYALYIPPTAAPTTAPPTSAPTTSYSPTREPTSGQTKILPLHTVVAILTGVTLLCLCIA